MSESRPPTEIRAWRPAVGGIAEVFHARFTEHAYPPHTHDTWDLMILDDGSLDFALDRRRHDAVAAGTGTVTLLPPVSRTTAGPSPPPDSASACSIWTPACSRPG